MHSRDSGRLQDSKTDLMKSLISLLVKSWFPLRRLNLGNFRKLYSSGFMAEAVIFHICL